jgi:hypothetical protein
MQKLLNSAPFLEDVNIRAILYQVGARAHVHVCYTQWRHVILACVALLLSVGPSVRRRRRRRCCCGGGCGGVGAGV